MGFASVTIVCQESRKFERNKILIQNQNKRMENNSNVNDLNASLYPISFFNDNIKPELIYNCILNNTTYKHMLASRKS